MGAALIQSKLRSLLTESFKTGDEQFNAQLAADWGKKNFDSDLPQRCLNEFTELFIKSELDFERMASDRLLDLLSTRMNDNRISTLSETNPEIELLKDLATGMMVPRDPDFVPNGASAETRPALRAIFKQTHKAVDFSLYNLIMKGLAFVLPMALAEKNLGIHFFSSTTSRISTMTNEVDLAIKLKGASPGLANCYAVEIKLLRCGAS